MSGVDSEFYEWEEPFLFEDFILQDWPNESLPEDAELFAAELARSTETPIELSSLMTFGAIASVCHKKYVVAVSPTYSEPVNIWVMAILPSGSRKTAVFSKVFFAVYEGENKIKEEVEVDCKRNNIRYKIRKERVKYLMRSAAQSKNANIDELESQILALESDISSISSTPQVWSGDVTPENLATLMSTNGEAMAILSDEGGIFDILSGLYSKGNANIDIFLQGHSGATVRVNRQSKPPILLNRAIISIALTVQPEVIITALNNKKFRKRGLLARFLYVYPKSNIGFRSLGEKPIDENINNKFNSAILAIFDHPLSETNIPHKLLLEKKAYEKWLEWSRGVERMMDPELAYLHHINDWASKLSGQILRLAGLMHVYRYAHHKPWEHEISLDDMERAIKVGHVLISHALKVFGSSVEEEGFFTAKMILKWITDSNIDKFTRRELLRKNRFLNKDDAKIGLNILKNRNYLHESKNQRNLGAPSMVYDVNPKIMT